MDDASSSSRVGRETHPAVEEMRAKERAIVVRSFVRSFDRASICRYDDRPNGDENDANGAATGAPARAVFPIIWTLMAFDVSLVWRRTRLHTLILYTCEDYI